MSACMACSSRGDVTVPEYSFWSTSAARAPSGLRFVVEPLLFGAHGVTLCLELVELPAERDERPRVRLELGPLRQGRAPVPQPVEGEIVFLDDEQALELFGAHGPGVTGAVGVVSGVVGASVTGGASTIGPAPVGPVVTVLGPVRRERGASGRPADRPNSSIFWRGRPLLLVRGRELEHREVLRCAGHERGPDARRVGTAGDRDAADVAHLVRPLVPSKLPIHTAVVYCGV